MRRQARADGGSGSTSVCPGEENTIPPNVFIIRMPISEICAISKKSGVRILSQFFFVTKLRRGSDKQLKTKRNMEVDECEAGARSSLTLSLFVPIRLPV